MRKQASISWCFSIFVILLACPADASALVWAEMMKAAKDAQNGGDLRKAEKLILAAVKEAQTDSSYAQEAQSMLWLARVYIAQDQREQAESMLKRSLTKAKSAPLISPDLLEEINRELANIREEKASASAYSSAKMNQSSIRKIQEAVAPFATGQVLFQEHNYSAARPLLEKVFASYKGERALKSEEGQSCLDMLYLIYRDGKEYDKAEKLLKTALDLSHTDFDNLDFNQLSGKVFLYLAGLFAIQGKDAEAEVMAKRGVSIICCPIRRVSDPTVIQIAEQWETAGKEQEAKTIRVYYDQLLTQTKQDRQQVRQPDLGWEEDPSIKPTAPTEPK
ncbi:MAG: tetratricopeptide repeat protein [Candidatus Obscuribacterales bacterium]|nr:tetratricopeptide repeat protein [Candidatus Obscuribacterales bacterium]